MSGVAGPVHLLLTVVAFFFLMPAVGSFSDEALHYSVSRQVGGSLLSGGEIYECRRRSQRLWSCEVEDPGGSGSAVYEVRRSGRRCWSARDTGRSGTEQPLPTRADGCVGLRDQARVFYRIL